MEGVILFADDHVFDAESFENKLFQKFNSCGSFSILPIDNLTVLEKTVPSISTYKALILDWNFQRIGKEEGIVVPDEHPDEFLKNNKIYSLVYVYSQADIREDKKQELQRLYPGKIYFETKNPNETAEAEYQKILEGIKKFEEENKHLTVPFVWSQAINQSAQGIFSELEQADPNWIKEIYNTAKEDEAEPNTEVIGVFQHLLNESVIQNKALLSTLNESAQSDNVVVQNKGASAANESVQSDNVVVQDKEAAAAKLYNRIYYTKLKKDAPLMTGDIFKFEDKYAILFTPECDINSKKETALEFLCFNKKDYEGIKLKRNKKELVKDFNNGNIKSHILPSFPFEADEYNLPALIDFKTALAVKAKAEFDGKRTEHKLNSPYIYQLRQRYLAYIGRVGVPAIPKSLALFNLNQ